MKWTETVDNKWQQIRDTWEEACMETLAKRTWQHKKWISIETVLHICKTRLAKTKALAEYAESHMEVKKSIRQDKKYTDDLTPTSISHFSLFSPHFLWNFFRGYFTGLITGLKSEISSYFVHKFYSKVDFIQRNSQDFSQVLNFVYNFFGQNAALQNVQVFYRAGCVKFSIYWFFFFTQCFCITG